jgi:hypothetical protein
MAFLTSWMSFQVAESLAMNWEGHDGWQDDVTLFQDVMEGVPQAIVKPLPACKVLRQRHAANVYEQAALPGKNCEERRNE